jgi:hypothetical protein
VAQEKRNLVDAFSGEQRPRGDRVPERVYRRQHTARNMDRPAVGVEFVQNREGRLPCYVACALLRLPERPRDIPLLQGSASAGREYEVGRRAMSRCELVPAEHACELRGDRHRPRRAIGLRRPPVAMPVNLPPELDLGLVEIVVS